MTKLQWLDYDNHRTPLGRLLISNPLGAPHISERPLLVYLPADHASGQRRYPVIYMHDGQNLFDAQTSYAGEWHVDETMRRLEAEGLPAIVVGIPNSGKHRMADYSPFSHSRYGQGRGDAYIHYLSEVVKPRIDRDFPTLPGRDHTLTLGSSMGGLISLYAIIKRPDVFGRVGAMSASLWLGGRAMLNLLAHMPHQGRIYMDYGLGEVMRGRGSTHGFYEDAREAVRVLEQRGFRRDVDLFYREAEGHQHREADWAARLPEALRVLLR